MPTTAFRRMFLAFALATGAGFFAGTGHAADAGGNFAIRGLGSQTCATYLAAIAKPDGAARYGSWLLGYASARNRMDAGTYDILPTEAGGDLVNMTAVICRSRPQMLLENAVNNLVRSIAQLRQSASSPLVQVRSGDTSVSIHQDSLKRLQGALIAKQLFRGAATGASSPQLIDALKAFQRQEGIAVTGLPDIDTFIRAIIKR